jgi:hypothetical protein
MWKTFYLKSGDMHVAGKVWSDFGATLPLERSFAYGSNFPPQYPIFAGPPIRYHFVFFLIVGILERVGVPLDWGLNTLSIVGFFGLLILLYLFAKALFKSHFVGILSVVLFLLNGSLSFLEFFKKHPISIQTPFDIIKNNDWSSFGPYDGKTVSAFWSLNIFTNQRHLALGYAFFIGLLYFLYTKNHKIELSKKRQESSQKNPLVIRNSQFLILGLLIGLFPFIHLTVYMMMCMTLLVMFFFLPNLRKQIFIVGLIAGILGIPQILSMGSTHADGVNFITPGYLISNKLTIQNFLHYWFFNLGITSILSLCGFILAKREQRKFFLPFLLFFVIGNIFQFSPEMGSNHKFFNMFVIGANIFSAYALSRVWKFHILGKVLVPICIFVMTFSGIIDIFPVFNDGYIVAHDIPNNPTAQFIVQNTPPNAVFLNAEFINDPASIAGRKIYLGWPYFAWSAGYDTNTRFKKMKMILASPTTRELCNSLKEENIQYIELKNPTDLEETVPNYTLFQEFTPVYSNHESKINIYSAHKICL